MKPSVGLVPADGFSFSSKTTINLSDIDVKSV